MVETGCRRGGVSGRDQISKARQMEHDPSQPCHIDSVPDEVLASILRLLPWRERIVNVERVSRRWRRVALEGGWSDWNVFNSREWEVPRRNDGKFSLKVGLRQHFAILLIAVPRSLAFQTRSLLKRCGLHLIELLLDSVTSQVILQTLRLSPAVRHLCLSGLYAKNDAVTVDQIAKSHGECLKSLQLENCLFVSGMD